MALIVVEHHFEPPLDMGGTSLMASDVSPCLPAYDVEWLNSYFASDGTRGVCMYEAGSAEEIRRLYRAAGVAFEGVWPAAPLRRSET